MPQNPPEGYQRVTPYLYYEDAAAALEWIKRAFGFSERVRMPGPGGRVGHAEVELEDGVVMLGEPMGDYFKSPRSLGVTTSSVYIYVDDVDAHCAKAREAGAEIIREPEDQFYGDRTYGAKDPEGHEWFFGQHVKDVSPEEMQAAMAEMSS
jgi:uncharacterized glyoxalase superfamily protein PhnB